MRQMECRAEPASCQSFSLLDAPLRAYSGPPCQLAFGLSPALLPEPGPFPCIINTPTLHPPQHLVTLCQSHDFTSQISTLPLVAPLFNSRPYIVKLSITAAV
jgi:hypothetical protein